jgi:Tfp pilus assembly major pilin PilA
MNKNKGFAGIGIIIAIIAILAVGSIAYYAGKSAKTEPVSVEQNNLPQENQGNVVNDVTNAPTQTNSGTTTVTTTTTTSTKSDCSSATTDYKNKNGYEICYPTNWFLTDTFSDSKDGNIVQIQNMKDVYVLGDEPLLKSNGTQIQIEVTSNMNYADYAEFIKDPKYVSSNVAAERLANLEMIKIGGKTLQAFTGIKLPSSTGKIYDFIYKNKLYKISFGSGSQTQYNNDLNLFNDLVSSFKFI